jgi:hypothetical protein
MESHVITVFDIPDIYDSKINSNKLNHYKIKEHVEKRASTIRDKGG